MFSPDFHLWDSFLVTDILSHFLHYLPPEHTEMYTNTSTSLKVHDYEDTVFIEHHSGYQQHIFWNKGLT